MREKRRWLWLGCALLTALACVAAVLFFSLFCRTGSGFTTYLTWEAVSLVEGETVIPLEAADSLTLSSLPAGEGEPAAVSDGSGGLVLRALPEGSYYRLTAVLPATQSVSQLTMELSGLEVELWLDGRQMIHSRIPWAAGPDLSQLSVPLPAGAEGRTLELRLRPLALEEERLTSLLPRMVDPLQEQADTVGYGNYYAIPAGAAGAAFLLVCFLFAAGLALGRPDWSLPVLALAAAALTAWQLSTGFSTMFLPARVCAVLSGRVFSFVPAGLMLLYLLLNFRRGFLRRLGWVTLAAAGVLLCAGLISLAHGGALAAYLGLMVSSLAEYSEYSRLLHWVTVYLAAVCTLLAVHGVTEAMARDRAEAGAMAIKAELAARNCRALEQSNRETAQLRHEMTHHISAMNLLYQNGEMEQLGQYLARLDRTQAGLTRTRFTGNLTVNAILQDAAARAAEREIRFQAAAELPEELSIPVEDLYALLMNLLDNALEAAARVPRPEDRFLSFRCHVKNGFLAIRCENSCAGTPETDPETGFPRTTKADPAAHGFGLRQMNRVAEAYHSLLDISFSDGVCTVQTALKLP